MAICPFQQTLLHHFDVSSVAILLTIFNDIDNFCLVLSILIIQQANIKQTVRRATKPTKGSIKRRLEGKNNRKQVKTSRKKVDL